MNRRHQDFREKSLAVQTGARIVRALKAGLSMVVTGTSSRGTLTTDTYFLRGATAAYAAVSRACRVKGV